MAIVAGNLLRDVSLILHDTTFQRWTRTMLYGFATRAQRTLVTLRPDANPRIEAIALTPLSTLQAIPATGHQLMDVIRNMGADGVTPGEVITLTTRDALDAANKDWHDAVGSPTIYNFVFDERVVNHFYVTPPPSATCHIEIKYSKLPSAITSDADVLEVGDAFEEALINHMVASALSVNIDSVQDRAAAKGWLGNFYLLIGQTAQATALLSPNNTNNNVTVNTGTPNG